MIRARFFAPVRSFSPRSCSFSSSPSPQSNCCPFLGGSAAVWITCLVFFQTALLCAYAYAHWLARHPRWLPHLGFAGRGVRSCRLLGVRPHRSLKWTVHPVATIFLALSLWIGLPFLTLGATSPLLQVWWSHVEGTAIPYRLFALSNFASLLALAAYPTLIEPNLTLHTQRVAWLSGFCALPRSPPPHAALARRRQSSAPSHAADDDSQPASPLNTSSSGCCCPWARPCSSAPSPATSPPTSRPFRCSGFCPSPSICSPSSLAFEFPRLLPRGIVARFLVVMLAAWLTCSRRSMSRCPCASASVFFLAELLFACLFCHSEAYALRPQRASESTRLLSAVRRRRRARLLPHRHRLSAPFLV